MRCRPGLRSGAGPAELQQEICCETECLQLTAWANVSSGSDSVLPSTSAAALVHGRCTTVSGPGAGWPSVARGGPLAAIQRPFLGAERWCKVQS